VNNNILKSNGNEPNGRQEVHERLSALQAYLKAEKEKLAKLTGG
jgi:hypothetical protein